MSWVKISHLQMLLMETPITPIEESSEPIMEAKTGAYAPQGAQQQFGSTSAQQQPPPSSPIEQEILNLSKVVGTFVEEQKVLNV